VCGCYRSPGKCKETDFLTSLSSTVENMFKSRQELLLLGDMNMDMYCNKDEHRTQNHHLVDFCSKFCLRNKISVPTRVTENTKTLIDVVLTSHQERYSTSGSLSLGVSDHDLVYVVRKNKLRRPSPHLIEYRSMKNFDQKKFLEDLNSVEWNVVYLNDNIDNVWEQWSTKYKEVLDQHAPVKKKWIRGDQLPWINTEILREISLRNKLFKHHKQNPCEQSWLAFKIQRNKVTSLNSECQQPSNIFDTCRQQAIFSNFAGM